MAHKNQEWAWNLWRESDAGNFKAFWDAHAEDVVYHMGGRNRFGGEFRGKQAVMAMFGRFTSEFPLFKEELKEICASDDHVVALWSGRVERDGKVFTGDGLAILRVENEKITRAWESFEDIYSWDEFINQFEPA